MPMGRIKPGWDHALLGCAPREPFAGSVPPEKTAVDYSDVDGAPPRRFSEPGHGARSCTLEDGERSRRWSSSVLDKPLSGGRAGSPAGHRKHLRADFFDDIFRGSTPWRSDVNLFSPSRETAGSTTRISRSSRMFTKNFDHWPSFRSPSSYLLHRQEVRTPDMLSFPSSPIFCAPATPSRLTRIKGYLRLDAHASYRQRPLSVKSAGGSRPPEAGGFAGDTTDETEEQQIKRETDGSTADVGSVPLHFSVYRWARKGVTLLMPSSLRESASGGSRSSPSMEHAEHPLGLDVEEVPQETTNAFKKMQDRILVNGRASGRNDNFDACLSERVRTGDEGITRRTKGKEDLVDNRLTVLHDVDGAEKIDLQKAGCRPESRAGRLKVNGEVKGGIADCPSIRVDNADEQDVSSCGVSSSRPDKNLKAELKSPVRGVDVESVDDRSLGGNDTPVSFSDFDDVDAIFCNMEELHTENIEEFLVEELSQDHCEDKGLELHQKEIYAKKPDTRIQEWLKGKEGNIRSLLSTLQYVLWPGSGWKPVPLVDIIESSSVRRAYQKALLCLHPDKLQQKGAQAHQKYIAEKVFDTLQEAWDRFNSISSL